MAHPDPKMERLNEAHKKAAKAICEYTKVAFPLGSEWMARGHSSYVHLKVTGHSSCWWSRPGYVYFINRHSGKERSIDVSGTQFTFTRVD